ncbi:hypothetical protein PENTCL1PPCAC_14899, partial [Pristionchus entomophagus]
RLLIREHRTCLVRHPDLVYNDDVEGYDRRPWDEDEHEDVPVDARDIQVDLVLAKCGLRHLTVLVQRDLKRRRNAVENAEHRDRRHCDRRVGGGAEGDATHRERDCQEPIHGNRHAHPD